MKTKGLEEKVKCLEIRMCELEKIISNLQQKSRDKTSPKRKSRDKTSPKRESGDVLSPECLEWSQPWKRIVGPVFKPAKSYWEFEKKYLCRSEGPTKYINEVIALSMDYPENRNFYVRSKRCYVCKNHKWELMNPGDFYPELRQKILTQYNDLLLRSQTKQVDKFATDCLARGSLNHWTNQKMEAMLSSKSCCRSP